MSDRLRAKLAAVRRKSLLVDLGTGMSLVAAIAGGAIGAEILCDWVWELPFVLRAAWLAVVLACVVFTIFRHVLQPVLRVPDDDQIALWVERHSPGLRSRLIAAIQLTRPQAVPVGQSMAMVGALVRQTEEIAEPMDFLGVVKTDRLAQTGGVAALILLLGTVGLAWGGSGGVDLLKRALLVPGVDVPRRTRVQLLNPNPMLVAAGEPVELRAAASGVVPKSGTVTVHYDGQDATASLPMQADPKKPGEFVLNLGSVSRSFSYRVHLNDGHSGDARVDERVRPAVTALDITQIYPAYTHLSPEAASPSDLRILIGSQLTLHVQANQPLKNNAASDQASNHITFTTKTGSVDVPLAGVGEDRQALACSAIAVPRDATGLSVHLINDDGLENKDPAVYPIQLIPDEPPTLQITYPDRKEQLSTARALLVVGIETRDDFALGKLVLHYRVLPPEVAQSIIALNGQAPSSAAGDQNSGPSVAASDNTMELDLHGTPRSFKGQFHFDLSQLKPPPLEHGAVEWWLEAQDTNDVTGPGKTLSDHYLCRIGTEAEVRSDLFARLGNHMGQIMEAAETQKQDNEDLGQMIQQKASGQGN